MSRYQEIPRVVDAVKFLSQHYGESPFAFENEEAALNVPQWITKLYETGKLVPFYTSGIPYLRYNFFHEDMTLVIEPGEWFVYNSNYRRNHQPEYQILSDEAFQATFERVTS